VTAVVQMKRRPVMVSLSPLLTPAHDLTERASGLFDALAV
jgi:hypothetical protein